MLKAWDALWQVALFALLVVWQLAEDGLMLAVRTHKHCWQLPTLLTNAVAASQGKPGQGKEAHKETRANNANTPPPHAQHRARAVPCRTTRTISPAHL